MAQALPSSIMHSGIQNRNKEMALDPKYTIRRRRRCCRCLRESSRNSICDLRLAQLGNVRTHFFRTVSYGAQDVSACVTNATRPISDYKKKYSLWSIIRIFERIKFAHTNRKKKKKDNDASGERPSLWRTVDSFHRLPFADCFSCATFRAYSTIKPH